MTTYTGVADANGDFTVTFGGAEYTAGQKVTVTAEKSGAVKNIELFAPSETISPTAILIIEGDPLDFPKNITNVTLKATGSLQTNCLGQSVNGISSKLKELFIEDGVTHLLGSSLADCGLMTRLTLPNTLIRIENSNAVSNCAKLLEINIPTSVQYIGTNAFTGAVACLKVDIGASITTIGASAFHNLTSCNEFICRAVAPPSLALGALQNLKATCVIRVPASSLDTYKTATNWSAYASRIVAI